MQPYPYTSYTPGRPQAGSAAPKPATGASKPAARRVPFSPADLSAVVIAGAGLAIVLTSMLPAGLITAPITFAKCRRFEQGVAQGRYNPNDRAHFTAARVMAWISLVLSLPSLLIGALMLAVMLAH